MDEYVVMFSGGVGSWAAAKRLRQQRPERPMRLLFCDTKTEDEDTYRFMREAAANLDCELIEIADGRDIWQVFRDRKFLGNTRVDLCSRILKREISRAWLDKHADPDTAVVVIGVDWSETNRFDRMMPRWLPWRIVAPLVDQPYLSKNDMHAWAEREGLRKQRLYCMGAAHANCGGGCVKMGQGGFARLHKAFPERFMEWEQREAEMREALGDVAILRDRVGGDTKPMTLATLRGRIEADDGQVDLFDIGGCGCFLD